jgi:hypothetical protein
MRLYTDGEEERMRAERLVREWRRSGLIDAAQGARLAAELQVDLRRTNVFLRAGLALFTALIVAASLGLLFTLADSSWDTALGIVVRTGIAGCVCIGLADYAVRTFRWYRFGVEETLAVAAVLLLAISTHQLIAWLFPLTLNQLAPYPRGSFPAACALAVGTCGGFGLYRRFGFVYAAIGAMACAAALAFQVDLPAAIQRALAAVILALILAVVRSKRLKRRDDVHNDDYGVLQAAALIGMYAVLNVQLFPHSYRVDGWFYWCTFALIWMLPVAGLSQGIPRRDRELIDASLVLALVTLLTNKAYLGWTLHTWDPILLGAVLVAGALGVRRWLSRGPGRERHGFTAARLLHRDRDALALVGTASVIFQPVLTAGTAPGSVAPAAPEFGGGRSGGGGGGGSF